MKRFFYITLILLLPFFAQAQVSTNYWKLNGGDLLPNVSTWGLKIPSLANLNCIGTDSSGLFQAGTCTGGSGSGVATTSLTASWPITLTTSASTITYGFNGLGTSTAAVIGNIPYFSGVNTFANEATGTISQGTGITVTGTGYDLGAGITIANSGVLSVSCTTITCSGTNPATFSIANGAISNAQLTNSTISGIALGSNLNSLSNDGTTLTGTSYNGSASVSNWAINLAHGNTWTALQQFNGNASTSALTVSGLSYLLSKTLLGGNTVSITTLSHDSYYPDLLVEALAGNTQGIGLVRSSNTNFDAPFIMARSEGTPSAPTDVQVGDKLGRFLFAGYKNGSWSNTFAAFGAIADATTSSTATPGALFFATTASNANNYTERMRIDENGNIGIASTSPTYQFSIGTTGSDFYVKSTGEVVSHDTPNNWDGQATPTRYISFKISTTTAWTGTSTVDSPYSDTAPVFAPFTGTFKNIICGTDAGNLTIEATDTTSGIGTYLVASTTAGLNNFTLAFTLGDKIDFIAGNPSSSPTSTPCTVGAIQNP